MSTMPNTIFPWQAEHWHQLINRHQDNKFPHALLMAGMPGLGKKQFSLSLAHVLLCNKADAPCGRCHSCSLVRAHSHPDLVLVEPEEKGQKIKIDQIRELIQSVNETALQGGLRVVIINPANALNINAANALLKTLEEPSPNTIFILISDQSGRLPATITSRCQKIVFHAPQREVALAWLNSELQENPVDRNLLLNLANGAPLKAKEWADSDLVLLRQELYQALISLAQRQADPLQLAVQWQEKDIQFILSLLQSWLQDLLRLKVTHSACELINYDYQAKLLKLIQSFSSERLLNYYDHIKKLYELLQGSMNLNKQLILEELLIKWMRYAAH